MLKFKWLLIRKVLLEKADLRQNGVVKHRRCVFTFYICRRKQIYYDFIPMILFVCQINQKLQTDTSKVF